MQEPILSVGILSAQQISVELHGSFSLDGGSVVVGGIYTASLVDGQIVFENNEANSLTLHPVELGNSFTLHDVVIGVDFHWERREAQRFRGALKLIVDGQRLLAINQLPVEEYLRSVISSEMSATASPELLKAHSVISRSWLLSQLEKKKNIDAHDIAYTAEQRTGDEWIKWWDREDHTLFDVCADDHCQRYQGITRASTSAVNEAVDATFGEVLMYENRICDARFSKCCGGVLELFENCWEPVSHPYLQKVFDRPSDAQKDSPDLSAESAAQQWIRTSPEAFCNTQDKKILSQVLNNYDQETTDFFRWTITYTQEELSNLLLQRTDVDFGRILDLIPVQRGVSGRLVRLKIVGTKRTMVIGKELLIRKSLSASHLYSSAFVVDKETDDSGLPLSFTLTGAGWGHGVGLCQIGAAVMGEQGYRYTDILMHYYRNAGINKLYQKH